jgi:hypothetical protein
VQAKVFFSVMISESVHPNVLAEMQFGRNVCMVGLGLVVSIAIASIQTICRLKEGLG